MRPAHVLMTAMALAALFALGCSSGGDGDGDGDSEFTVAFLPATNNPGSPSVTMSEGGTAGDLVTVDINVTNMDGVFAADFELEWNTGRARYLGWEEGSLLSKDGESTSFSVTETASGTLRIEGTRVGTMAEVNAVGTERLISIDFRIRRRGDTPLSFVPPGASTPREITDSGGSDVSGNDWSGGDLFAG